MKAVGYVRVSTEEQASEGVSLAAQESALRAYCAMRGLELGEIVSDAGVSGGKALSAREGGRRVLAQIKSGRVQAVVAWKLDRLFRDCGDCLDVTRNWDKRGVALHLIDLGGQAVDTSTAMGRFFLTVMGGCAELERNQIRERTTAGLAYKRTRGERVGQVPYGSRLSADGVHLEPEPAEQAVIARVRQLRAEGLSLRAVVVALNDTSTPARGGRWHLTSVRRLLARAA